MKVYIASRRFQVAKETYFQVPEGTIFVYNGKYRIEMDRTRYPPIITLPKDKFDQIKSAGNGNLLEMDIEDKKIEKIFELNEEKNRTEDMIKDKLKAINDKINKELFYKGKN